MTTPARLVPTDTGPGALVLYVACAESNELFVVHANDEPPRLRCIQRLPVPPGITPLTVAPDERTLWVGFRSDPPALASYAIDPSDGRLTHRRTTALIDPPMYLNTDRTGAIVLTASYAGASVSVYATDADGNVAAAPLQHVATPPKPHAVLTDPTNRFAFVTVLGADTILRFAFDARTGVQPRSARAFAAPPGSGPRHLAVHPSRPILYVNGELDASISAFEIAPDSGDLRLAAHRALLARGTTAGGWGADIAIDPHGRFLLVTERRTSTVARCLLGADAGDLRVVDIQETEERPRSLALDPAGRALTVVGERSNRLALSPLVDRDGSLGPPLHLDVGTKPVWVRALRLRSVP